MVHFYATWVGVGMLKSHKKHGINATKNKANAKSIGVCKKSLKKTKKNTLHF